VAGRARPGDDRVGVVLEGRPEIETGEMVTEDIGTEVFFMPAATHTEKSGTFTNTQRLVQWRHKAVEPPGDAISDLEFYHQLGVRMRQKLAGSTRSATAPAGHGLGLPARRRR
jgi:formate dehydrogenase major subunit